MAYSDENEQDDDQQGGDQQYNDQSNSDQSDDYNSQSGSDQTDGSPAEAIAGAPAAVQDAHRNAIGSVLENLQSRGIDVASLAEKAGVDSSDVDQLSHGDLASMTSYLSEHHPEALQAAASRFPAAQGLLSSLGSGGGLGGMLGKFLG